jgi:hypothetical protein
MDTKNVPTDLYLQQLRALGAWWRLGSSALGPQLLVESMTEASRAGHGGVDLDSARSRGQRLVIP